MEQNTPPNTLTKYGYGYCKSKYSYSYNADGTVKKIVEKTTYDGGDADQQTLKITYGKVKVKKSPAALPVEYDPIIGQFMTEYWSLLPEIG